MSARTSSMHAQASYDLLDTPSTLPISCASMRTPRDLPAPLRMFAVGRAVAISGRHTLVTLPSILKQSYTAYGSRHQVARLCARLRPLWALPRHLPLSAIDFHLQ